MKQTGHHGQHTQKKHDVPGVYEMERDVPEPSHGIETNPCGGSQCHVLCDETSYGWVERVVETNESLSDGVGQEISIPKIPQHLNMMLKGRP